MSTLTHSIATFFWIGHLRPAPGTWGSLAALPVGWALHAVGGTPLLLLGIILSFTLGWWATALETKGKDDHDPSEIVIDEVAGQWIAILPLSIGATHVSADILTLWPGWVSAFLLFRFFDILKPGPIGWADRRGDALGVMLDDIIAGIFAAIGVAILAGAAHGILAI